MTRHTQECKSCGQEVEGEIYHLGFSDMDCMYCDSCPRVLLLKSRNLQKENEIEWPSLKPEDEGWQYYNRHLLPAYEKLESLFKTCECGGRFRAWAVPRCSLCNEPIFGDTPEPDKPSTWRSKYVFVTVGSYTDVDYLNV